MPGVIFFFLAWLGVGALAGCHVVQMREARGTRLTKQCAACLCDFLHSVITGQVSGVLFCSFCKYPSLLSGTHGNGTEN